MIPCRASERGQLSVISIISGLTVDGQRVDIVFVNYPMKLGAANPSPRLSKVNPVGLFVPCLHPDLLKFSVLAVQNNFRERGCLFFFFRDKAGRMRMPCWGVSWKLVVLGEYWGLCKFWVEAVTGAEVLPCVTAQWLKCCLVLHPNYLHRVSFNYTMNFLAAAPNL